MQLHLALLSSIALVTSFGSASVDPNDKGKPLFSENHPNITYLTDKNWDFHMNKTDKPWLVNFYHPFCPHCKYYASIYVDLAAYYMEKGTIYLGAISCMDHVKCRRVEITGFPTLMTLNFDKRNPKMENKRVIGTYSMEETKDYVTSVFAEVTFNTTGSWPSGYTPPSNKTKEFGEDVVNKIVPTDKVKATPKPALWEESTLPMNRTTRIQDAASAFVFGLKQGVFMAGNVMADEELDALKSWLKVVSKTFPGATNRKIIMSLYEKVMDMELLDFDTWDATVKTWQNGSVAAFIAEESRYNYTGINVEAWQRLNNLFVGQGATYRACALYTCGQWNMFHMLTMNPPETGARSGELLVSVAASIRRFVKHFFGCVDCRNHFLKDNTLEVVKKIKSVEDKPLALRRWLWMQHNSVNKRVNHPLWPKPEFCASCGSDGAWESVEVDKWLMDTFSYRDVIAPLVKTNDRAPLNSVAVSLHSATDKKATKASPFSQQVEKKAKETPVVKELTAKEPIAVEPEGGDAYRPKDAELGIKNAANTKELVVEMKNEYKDGLQGVAAPPLTLFAWYILPVAAVGGYLFFMRYRSTKQKGYRQVLRK